MAQEVLLYLSLIIVIAAVLTVIAKIIKQPPIIAYLISGILVGPLFLKLIGQANTATSFIGVFAHIGVAFLLFIVGLSLDFRLFKEIGGVASIAGLSEIALTGTIGFFIALALGFKNFTAMYIATAMAFSSTVVVVKILSDKKEIDTLHGRITLGILIVEDFVASIALMAIPLIQKGNSVLMILRQLGLVIGLILLIFLFSAFILMKLLDYLARNQEVLFLSGIAWALILATLFDLLGFSLEIGALIAGMSLASSKYTLELGGKMKPLRDFFVVLFFVFFGTQLSGAITLPLLEKAALFSIFILIGKPIIIMSILRTFGYKKRTNFLAGSSLAQISEFSLIIILLSFTLGQISQEVMNLVILTSLFTIGVSSYNIYYAHTIFDKLSGFLNIFEGKKYEKEREKEESFEVILFGYHRIGYKILETLEKLPGKLAIVDYNPKVIISLSKKKINCIYGDAGDADFLSQLNLDKAKIIVSTIPEESTNRAILERLKKINSSALFIGTAEQPRIALDLYENGADYVIVPHHLGGDYAANMLSHFKLNKQDYQKEGRKHYLSLKKAKNNSSFM